MEIAMRNELSEGYSAVLVCLLGLVAMALCACAEAPVTARGTYSISTESAYPITAVISRATGPHDVGYDIAVRRVSSDGFGSVPQECRIELLMESVLRTGRSYGEVRNTCDTLLDRAPASAGCARTDQSATLVEATDGSGYTLRVRYRTTCAADGSSADVSVTLQTTTQR